VAVVTSEFGGEVIWTLGNSSVLLLLLLLLLLGRDVNDASYRRSM
jgi:hypothetical protein